MILLGEYCMVDPIIFKHKIESLLSQQYKVEFLGKNFDQIVLQLTEVKAEKMYVWIEEVSQRKVQPLVVGSTKKYKG